MLDRVLWNVECFARGLGLGSVYSAVKVFLLNGVCRICSCMHCLGLFPDEFNATCLFLHVAKGRLGR